MAHKKKYKIEVRVNKRQEFIVSASSAKEAKEKAVKRFKRGLGKVKPITENRSHELNFDKSMEPEFRYA